MVNPQGGYSHFKTYGDVPHFWVGFLKEISKHGSIFHGKNPYFLIRDFIGLIFKIFPGFAWENFEKIAKNGYFFSEKSLNMGTFFFLKNYP